MHSKADIVADLEAMGLKRGDSVITHTAFKSIGGVEGGVHTLINALADVVLPDGALLFPNLYIPHGFTVENPPRFDLKKDSIRKPYLGITPEIFKFEFAKHFSFHPTHSLSGSGDKAEEMLKDHEKAGYCCGRGTPWLKNAEAGGKVLLIGCTQHSNTTYHTAEELMEDPYRLTDDVIHGVCVLDGKEIVVPTKLHVWKYPIDFDIINEELASMGHLLFGKIGDADSICLDAKPFVDLALEKMSEDRWYFVTGEEFESEDGD